jgi:hypothetical protein
MAAEPAPLAPHRIEAARSGRSRCRTCQHKIPKGVLRLGILIDGPYGASHLWHHLTCAARQRFAEVEAAYAELAWDEEVEPPSLAELAGLRAKAEEERAKRRPIPYLDRAPTGRGRCKHCGQPFEQGALRITLLREVRVGRALRAAPIQVHPRCARAELSAEHCLTDRASFPEHLRDHSPEMGAPDVERALSEMAGPA